MHYYATVDICCADLMVAMTTVTCFSALLLDLDSWLRVSDSTRTIDIVLGPEANISLIGATSGGKGY